MLQELCRFFTPFCILAACLSAVACDRSPSPTPVATAEPAGEAAVSRVVHFPQHEQPISTGDGTKIFLGKLVVKEGCLRLVGDRPMSLGDVYQKYPVDGFLLVWPPGYSLNTDVDPAQIVDNAGLTVARVGDTVRVSGNSWSRRSFDPPATPFPLPLGCEGPRLLIGDQVHAITPDEPTEIKLPGSTLFFPRQKTPSKLVELELVRWPGELVLDGDCIRWDRPGRPVPGPVLVWPAGFTPHIENGVVVVRNGGGRTIARIGETLSMIGRSGPDYPGKCAGGGSYEILRLSTDR